MRADNNVGANLLGVFYSAFANELQTRESKRLKRKKKRASVRNVRVNLYLTPRSYKAAQNIATEKGLKTSLVIRELVDKFFCGEMAAQLMYGSDFPDELESFTP